MPLAELTLSTYPHGTPLFGSGRRVVNLYAEKAEGQSRQPYTLIGCPGMKSFASPSGTGSLEIRGFTEFSDTIYAVIGSFLFSVASGGTATQVASGIAGTGRVSMASDNNELVIITNGSDYIFDGTDISQFTGANVVDWADVDYIDGRAVYVQASPDIPGRFSWSDVNALTTVGANSFANAESEPDALKRVKVIDRVVWLFGVNTLEPWFATGESTVFARDSDGIEEYGLGADDSVAELNERGFFLAVSRRARSHVRMIAGERSHRISNNAIDAIIDSGTYSDAIGFAYSRRGHDFYCLVLPTLKRCFVYDVTTGFWHERQSGTDIVAGWDARYSIVAHDKVLVGGNKDGKIYELDFDTHTDAGNKRMAMFTARLPSSGEYWNRLDKVLLDMTVGVGAAGASVEPQIVMQKSTDGGQTWGDERWRGIGFSGDYDRQVKWHGCGRFRHMDLRFRITDSVAREIVAVHASGRPGRMV